MKIKDFSPFLGQHCETTTTGSLLLHLGLELSEPMLFGLGQGLSFIYWNMKSMEMPFLGGRVKPDVLTQNLCRNLGLELHVMETTSKRKAWAYVENLIMREQPVGLKLDCYHLSYFSTKIHFAGHYVLLYGFDDETAFLVDTESQGGLVETSLESLALARAERGPMSSHHLSYTISGAPDSISSESFERMILSALHANATEYLNPPISNISYRGILRTSQEIKKWFQRSENPEYEFRTTASLMERAGTGGALFRNFFRDFLKESFERTEHLFLREAWNRFVEIAELWTQIAAELDSAGAKIDIEPIKSASQLLSQVAELEKMTMKRIEEATTDRLQV